MADTYSLLYAFPDLVEYFVPHLDGTAQVVRYQTKHAVAFSFSSNLAAGRRLTGNPGLPQLPPPAVPGVQPTARGIADKLAMLSYMCNIFWDIHGGVPAKPIESQYAVGLTNGIIEYYEPNP